MTPEIEELIRRRRGQMFVHSYIYYVLGDNIITDALWQQWANELRDLQQQYGYEIDYFDEQFKDWTGDTGMHLQPSDMLKKVSREMLKQYYERKKAS